ncbi:Fumarate reductase flavoprotein subunit [Mycena kentingensis (nom. inval.)]|nr:Fumarate reductase flavoprotein subunit [Mycena kentingensis (nom. inval.)]
MPIFGTSSRFLAKLNLTEEETRSRMRNATILVVRLRGTATEVIKNIVLSGIGKLVVLDEADVQEEDLGAGFFFRDQDVGKKRVDAAKERIESLNPLVIVETIATFPEPEALENIIRDVDLVCVTDWDRDGLVQLNQSCRRLGKPFYAGGSYGIFGYIFCDLISHECTAASSSKDAKAATMKFAYPSLSDALSHRWTALNRQDTKAANPAAVFTILGLWEFQKRHGRLPQDATDSEELESIANSVLAAADVNKKVLTAVPPDLVESVCATAGTEFSPVCAVVGGMLAQDILKALGKRDPPIANFYTFDGNTGGGSVVRMAMP